MSENLKKKYEKPVLKTEEMFEKNVLACAKNGSHCTYKQQGVWNILFLGVGSLNSRLEIKIMTKTLEKGFNISFKALGNSMKPFISSGNVITVAPVEAEKLSNGDVILYVSNGNFCVHRLIEKYIDDQQYFFVTKGDNRFSNDPPIKMSQIKGKVIKVKKETLNSADGLYLNLINYMFTMIPMFFVNKMANLKNKAVLFI